jgi:Cu(I)/Ag(I) efflux system membrane protein CusA/SilA
VIENAIEWSIRNRFLVLLAFLVIIGGGLHAVVHTPVDAIPDLSENQVIVFTDWMGRSPREIEDQITYPLSVNLQGLAGVKSVRSSSEFNFSMIGVIFEDGVDFYFARQRVAERLALATTFLPGGVVPYLAPDATALGQIFWYTVEGAGIDPGRLRAIQDWYVRYQLNAVPGVAQVASVGGSAIEYQIDVDPVKLRAHKVTLGEVQAAVARANSAVGGRVVHKGNAEYLVRGVGWIRSTSDLEQIVVKTAPERGVPVYVSSVGRVALGPQFRRSVLEKDGDEVTGGVVLMRHGENPLEVTRRVKAKIAQLSPGLPEGVRIVPFYERTRLIEGAIHTLTETLLHEMAIATIAILAILGHARSAFVICSTLPLSVLVSFILMRLFGIASNIMSLSGIAISIGILVDQAIVMVENATHHLSARFGREPVAGDTRDIVIPACRMVGRPIFFSVMIILISFVPVFALTGQEGKTFHPLAFTKSFAMVGVAIISITLVPALIPTFVRGRLRKEEENWIVSSLIEVYRPVLTWALPRRNLVMWSFAALLILGAGIFPLDALAGTEWESAFLGVWGLVTALTVLVIDGGRRRAVAFVSLVVLGMAAQELPRIGKEYMPPLDEGSILDMPITVPRASVTQVADDLKTRDAVIREFPEVEQLVGKAGRADTPTDPAPLDMVETVVNLRPRDVWPRRHLRTEDAQAQVQRAQEELEAARLMRAPATPADRGMVAGAATMAAVTAFDAAMRRIALHEHVAFERRLARELAASAVRWLLAAWRADGRLLREPTASQVDALIAGVSSDHGRRLASGASQEDIDRLVAGAAAARERERLLRLSPEVMSRKRSRVGDMVAAIGEVVGLERGSLFTELAAHARSERDRLWSRFAGELDDAIVHRAASAFDWAALAALARESRSRGLWIGPAGDLDSASPATAALVPVRERLDPDLAASLLLWRKTKAQLVQEMDTALQMPGWGNIWTQPIINRIDMLATGVRTMIGVKVFGSDLAEIQRVSQEVAAALRAVPGAADVFPDQSVGKGYVEVEIDRRRAARYGVSVGDVQDVIEGALGGKPVTTTVEGRERHPVRIRYARASRTDEVDIGNVLVSAAANGMPASGMPGVSPAAPPAAAPAAAPMVPLSMVADVKVVEGPSMIKSENGRLRSYVQLNVRDRDIVGFVEEAQRVVAQSVKLPPGMHLEWSGQFEHKIRSDRTMRLVFPVVMLIIFVILYLTYGDLMDAGLMMMAVPEALVGGVFFLWLTGFHYSVAVQVGFIACFGMATETGIIMLVYLRDSIERRGGLEGIGSLDELRQAVIEGAVHRLRPKLLTEGVAIVALAPMLWATGVGHEVISAMAAPVLGGLLIADEVVDLFIPVRFYWIRRARWLALHGGADQPGAAPG